MTERNIRVFISSTFSDMQKERNYLIRKVFPDIRRECRRRNVEFTPLDLRWGITEEEATNGRVVEICMDEIERTRPFFIGLVGGRYGWVPEQGESGVDLGRLAARYPWISPYLDSRKSITEMEMLYGVLDNPAPVEAHFFLRNELSVPRRFREKDPERRRKLSELRERIRHSADEGRCSASDYTTVASLGRAVHRRLMEMIDRLYPLEETPDIYGLYAAEQERKLADLRKVYTDCNRIPLLTESTGDISPRHIDIFTGAPGSGLSAIVANQLPHLLEYKDARGNIHEPANPYEVVYTIVDENVDTQEMLMRMFINTLRSRYPGVDCPAPNPADNNPIPFAEMVKRFHCANCLWVIDGVEKLTSKSDRNLGRILSHTDIIPCMIITCSDPEVVKTIEMASEVPVKVRQIEPLIPVHIHDITVDYLGKYSKRLNERQISAISASKVFTSVKMLRAFIDKLVTFGIFEDVDRFIHSFATLDTSAQFYDRLLQYLEEEHGADNVRELFSRLQASQIGMSEEGLFRGITRNPLDKAALLASVEPWTRRSRGNILLASGDATAAVQARYPLDEHEQKRLSRLIVTDCRRVMNTIVRGNREGRFTNFIMRRLVRGVPGILDDNEMVYYSAARFELLHQYMSAGRRRKAMGLLRHFGLISLGTDWSKMMPIISRVRETVRRPGRMFDSLDIIVEHYLFDGQHTISLMWKKFFENTPEETTMEADIRRKWLPRKVRAALNSQLGFGPDAAERPFAELFDENRPDDIAVSDLFIILREIIFIPSYSSESFVRRLYERFSKAIENSREEQNKLFYIRCAASCVIRLGLHDEWMELKRLMVQSEYYENVRLDIMVLDLYEGTLIGRLNDEETINRCDEIERVYREVNVDLDNYFRHIVAIIRNFRESRPKSGELTLSFLRQTTEAMRQLASFMLPDNIYSSCARAADAFCRGDRPEMAVPAYRAILERELTPSSRGYYLYALGDALASIAERDSNKEYATPIADEAMELYDKCIEIFQNPAVTCSLINLEDALYWKMSRAINLERYSVAFKTADSLMELYRAKGDRRNEASVLNSVGAIYSRMAIEAENGDKEARKDNYRKAMEHFIKAREIAPNEIVFWSNAAYNLLKFNSLEPQPRAVLEQMMADGERLRREKDVSRSQEFQKYFVNLALELGREQEAAEMVAEYPDINYFERQTRIYPLIRRANPALLDDPKYISRMISYAYNEFNKPEGGFDETRAKATLCDIIDSGQAPRVIDIILSKWIGCDIHSVAMALARMTGQNELADKTDETIARELAENMFTLQFYKTYYFARLVADGRPFFELKNPGMWLQECRGALIDRFTGAGAKERRLYILARGARLQAGDAAGVVPLALDLEGPESKTLQDVAMRFFDEIGESNYNSYLRPLATFVGELEKAAAAGTDFPAQLMSNVREAVEALCRCMYVNRNVPVLEHWRTFAAFLRRFDPVLPAYVTLAGIYQLDADEREELFKDYMTLRPDGDLSDDGSSAVVVAYYWAMRGDGMDGKADSFIDFLLNTDALSDEARNEMMAEKAKRQRCLGDYKGALDVVREAGEGCRKHLPVFFEVLTSLLAGEFDGFEQKLGEVASEGTELEIGLYRSIYCLKVDNLTTAEKLRASLPELDEMALEPADVDEISTMLEKTQDEAALSALYNIELVRYRRRHGLDDATESARLLDEAARLLDYMPNIYLYIRRELESERAAR